MKKIFNFLKGFVYFNGILGGFIFWILFPCFLVISWLASNLVDVSDFIFIMKIVSGFLFVVGLPCGISFGLSCVKHDKGKKWIK